jgi:hypothetical protein
MAKRGKAKKKTAARKNKKSAARRTKKRAGRGTSALAVLARSHNMTIAELKGALPPCGKWSTRKRKSTRKSPCRT